MWTISFSFKHRADLSEVLDILLFQNCEYLCTYIHRHHVAINPITNKSIPENISRNTSYKICIIRLIKNHQSVININIKLYRLLVMSLSSPKRQFKTWIGVRILFFEQQWHSVHMFAKLRYWYISEMKCITKSFIISMHWSKSIHDMVKNGKTVLGTTKKVFCLGQHVGDVV